MARVQSVLRRTHVSSFSGDEKPFNYGDLTVDFSHHEVSLAGKPVKLTPTEYQLLYHLSKNAGKVLTHRNSVGVNSMVGEGSSFHFSLPLRR